MKTQNEMSLLADQELDAVVGGRMNDGKQQLINKDQRGVPGSFASSDLAKIIEITAAAAVVTAAALFGGGGTVKN
jgi:hypothetical protein